MLISTFSRSLWADENENQLTYICLGGDRSADCSDSSDFSDGLFVFTFLILCVLFSPNLTCLA